MSLLPTTRELLALVERETGYPVKVLEDPNLPVLATVRMARGNVPAHFVIYRPTRDEVQKIGYEIALLGMNGLDVNDPAPKHRLRSLPGEYSGLQLVSLMYVAFKQTAPDQDIGFNLASEYRMAVELYEGKSADQ